MESKDLLCERCTHREVCSYKKIYIEAQKSVNNVNVISDDSFIRLKDITWIRPVTLQCIHYEIDNQIIAR